MLNETPEPADFPLVQKELAHAPRITVELVALFIWADMNIIKHALSISNAGVTVAQISFPGANGLDFGAY